MSSHVAIVRHPSATISGRTISALVHYGSTPTGVTTAQNIVRTKIYNCRGLLTNYRQARERCGSPHAHTIAHAQHCLGGLAESVASYHSKRALFLHEARAAHVYWRVLKTMCHLPPTWKRQYPKAADPFNRLLNVGYHNLTEVMREALLHIGLLPQIGILHGNQGPAPLAYDLMEVFRQPTVDALIVPLFSRKQTEVVRLPRGDMSQAMTQLHQLKTKRFPYRGRCESLTNIVYHEAVALRTAIDSGELWQPYQHSWRHGRACQE